PANAAAAHARGGGHERVCRRQTALDRGASLRTLALSYTPHTPRRRGLLVAVPTPVVWFRLLTLASREGRRVGSNGYNKRLREGHSFRVMQSTIGSGFKLFSGSRISH